jgi:putative membrane protein
MSDGALKQFGLSDADLIGEGGEARVYALGEDRVLRLCHGDASEYGERRRAFYDRLRECSPPFEVAHILSHGFVDGQTYTIEKRMRGRDFAQVLYPLKGPDREKALTSYLNVAEQIGLIQFPDALYRDAFANDPIQSESWPDFLRKRTDAVLQISRADVEEDVPRFAEVEAYFLDELQQFEGMKEKCLVHGDYFPGNVFMDDDLNICGVGDFSGLTVIGDPRMDLAGAVAYVEVVASYQPGDTTFLLRLVTERYGEEIKPILAFYRLYYSIFFTGCKSDARPFYDWCIGNIRDYLEWD